MADARGHATPRQTTSRRATQHPAPRRPATPHTWRDGLFTKNSPPLALGDTRDQVSRQVWTEMGKNWRKEAPSSTRPEKRPETKGEGRARGRASREADRASEVTQTKHERNQAEHPMRLGVDSRESGRSRTKSLARHKAKLARTPDGTRASNERNEPVPCGKRCRRCSTLKEKPVSKRRTQSASRRLAVY